MRTIYQKSVDKIPSTCYNEYEEKERKVPNMKTLKIALIATIVTVAIIALCGVATATAEDLPKDFYELSAVVIGWERIGETDLRTIDCMTEDGTMWSFFDDENTYKIGDEVSLIMWECTEAEEDDEVIEVVKIREMDPEEVAEYLRKVKY